VAAVLTLEQTKEIRINIHKQNNIKLQLQTIQNTVNTSTRITKTPTQVSKHPHIRSPTHYKKRLNNHSTRYTPNKIVTIQSNTLSIRSP